VCVRACLCVCVCVCVSVFFYVCEHTNILCSVVAAMWRVCLFEFWFMCAYVRMHMKMICVRRVKTSLGGTLARIYTRMPAHGAYVYTFHSSIHACMHIIFTFTSHNRFCNTTILQTVAESSRKSFCSLQKDFFYGRAGWIEVQGRLNRSFEPRIAPLSPL
jgi:hypothetical protein